MCTVTGWMSACVCVCACVGACVRADKRARVCTSKYMRGISIRARPCQIICSSACLHAYLQTVGITKKPGITHPLLPPVRGGGGGVAEASSTVGLSCFPAANTAVMD